MHFIHLFNRVWVKGRDGEHTIVRIDHPTRVVDLCPPPGGTDFVTNVPFNLLSAFPPSEQKQSEPRVADTLDASNNVLNSSWRSLRSSYVSLVELHDTVRATKEIIHATLRRIADSDDLIARAGFGPRRDESMEIRQLEELLMEDAKSRRRGRSSPKYPPRLHVP